MSEDEGREGQAEQHGGDEKRGVRLDEGGEGQQRPADTQGDDEEDHQLSREPGPVRIHRGAGGGGRTGGDDLGHGRTPWYLADGEVGGRARVVVGWGWPGARSTHRSGQRSTRVSSSAVKTTVCTLWTQMPISALRYRLAGKEMKNVSRVLAGIDHGRCRW